MNVQHSLTTKDIFCHASIITLKIAHFILINMPTKKLFFPRINAIPASPSTLLTMITNTHLTNAAFHRPCSLLYLNKVFDG